MNRNTQLITDSFYNELPIMTARGPLVLDYLNRAYDTLYKAWSEYPWLTGIRCDLSLPMRVDINPMIYTNEVMERFIASLRAKIRSHHLRRERGGNRVHPCQLRYLWTREYTHRGRPHYHVVLLLNYQAFFTLGAFELCRDNLYNRIVGAWASALGVAPQEALGLVNFDEEEVVLPVKGEGDIKGFANLFYRASYLCKYETKAYAHWEHCFETSRI